MTKCRERNHRGEHGRDNKNSTALQIESNRKRPALCMHVHEFKLDRPPIYIHQFVGTGDKTNFFDSGKTKADLSDSNRNSDSILSKHQRRGCRRHRLAHLYCDRTFSDSVFRCCCRFFFVVLHFEYAIVGRAKC